MSECSSHSGPLPTITITMPDLWHLLQTSDSAFPVGGFAHSYGLEGMVQAGAVNTPDELALFINEVWLPLMTHVDFPLVRLSHERAGERDAILRLDELARACRATAEARRAQQQMGAQRLKMVADMTGHPAFALWRETDWHTSWPVVWGLEAGLLNTPLPDCLISYGYQSINGLLTASAKLIRIGPTEIQRQLTTFGPRIRHAVDESMHVREDDIGWFTPLLDITGAAHETAYTRIFIS